MFKRTLFLAALLFLQQVTAKTINGNSSGTESSAICIDCMNTKTSMDAFRKFAEEMRNITDGAIHVDKIISDKNKYAPKCEKFADDGDYQKLGQATIKEVHRPENTSLYQGTSDLNRICPNYQTMSKDEKDGLWVLFAAGWTQKETSCEAHPKEHLGPKRKDGSKRGILSGIIQLDKNREDYYTYGKLCRKGDSLNPESSLRCGFSMLAGFIELGHPLFSDSGYWEVLRPHAPIHPGQKINGYTQIRNSLVKYPPCGSKEGIIVASARPKHKKQVSSAKSKTKVRVASNTKE